MIVVISSELDSHATTVLAGLARLGADATLLDLSNFPVQTQLSVKYRHESAPDYRVRDGSKELTLADCGGVWWRRPQPFQIHPDISNPGYRDFALSESQEAFTGLWLAVNAFWVNQPIRDQAAARKVYQLRLAQDVGFETPITLVTNSPDEARAFVKAQGADQTIYKAFSATAQHWRETRLLKSDEFELLDSVRFAPVIFQEYVPAQADLRITMMGENVFAAAIYSQETSYPMDFRMEIDASRVEPFDLPREVTERLHVLMDRIGLVYGAIDMRLTPDGRYVFLEINPAGQWLFVEHRTGQPMTETFVRLLVAHDEKRS
jgi:glutathione synthase/RimK-type ligase-like ATP-grasp enzyme